MFEMKKCNFYNRETTAMKVCLAILFACLIFVTACTPSAVAPAEGKLKILTEVYPPYNFVDKNMNLLRLL